MFAVESEAGAEKGLEEVVVVPRSWSHNQEALDLPSRFRVERVGV